MNLNLESAHNMATIADRQFCIAHYVEKPAAIVAYHHIKDTLGQLYDMVFEIEMFDGRDPDDEQLAEALATAEKAVTWNDKAHRRDDSEDARLTRWALKQTIDLIKRAREAIVRQEDQL